MQKNDSIERLIMRQTHVGVSLGRQLSISLQTNCTLTHIELGSNRLGDEGVSCLVRALGNNVLYLGVSDNQAGPKSALALLGYVDLLLPCRCYIL